MKSSDLLNSLPSVNDLLEHPQVKGVVDRLNRSTVATRVRSFLDELRDEVGQQANRLPTLREVVDRVTRYVARDEGWRLGGAVNATGRLRGDGGGGGWVSTPLADAAVERVLLLSKDYGRLADAAPGGIACAADAVEPLKRLTGAEAAAVFHSRAGALSLALSELAGDSPVAVARGDVGEVDPGCRLTDLCNAAGVTLREVGAADAASVDDYNAALDDGARAVLRVAAESYRVVGAEPPPPVGALAAATHDRGAVLIEDLGGASLIDLPALDGVASTSAAAAISAGADLVLVRGDGLLGGPACCVALGRPELIDRLLARPTAAAQRPDAPTVAALAATTELLADTERAPLKIPLLSLLSTPQENLRTRAERLAPQIAASSAVASAEAVELSAEAAVVSGLPYRSATVAIAVAPADGDAAGLADHLAKAPPAVLGRVEGDRLVLDLRTVFPRQDLALVSAFPSASESPSAGTAAGEQAPTGEIPPGVG